MKTKTVTIQLTTDEVFELAYALEAQIVQMVEEAVEHKTTKLFLHDDCETEIKILGHFVEYHGYRLLINTNPQDFTAKYFHYVDDWYEFLIKQTIKNAKNKAETDAKKSVVK